jgi:rod shape-determining protein MreC
MLVASLGLMTIDGSVPRADKVSTVSGPTPLQSAVINVRSGLLTLTSPVFAIAEAPYRFSGFVSDIGADRSSLLRQRDQLESQLLLLQQQQQRFTYLQQENTRLRQLLGSKAQLPSEVTIAEIIGVSPNPQRAELLLDKGQQDGVIRGQAVVDAQGVFGQVIEVSTDSCWVLLITDRDHAIPVRNSRTGVRMILGGIGGIGGAEALVLEDLPASTDILFGDVIETSGLGGRFPVGYPVGVVTSLGSVQGSPYLSASVKPSAALSKVGHVLIIANGSPQPVSSKALSDSGDSLTDKQADN